MNIITMASTVKIIIKGLQITTVSTKESTSTWRKLGGEGRMVAGMVLLVS
jgi:hypothetical protein